MLAQVFERELNMALPLCEICQLQDASVWICLQFQGQTEQHRICMDCVAQIAEGEMTHTSASSHLDVDKLQQVLAQLQMGWDELEPKPEHDETLQKLQAMMGDDTEAWSNLSADVNVDVDVPLAQVNTDKISDNAPHKNEARCAHCQTSWHDVHEGGLMGCPQCYVAFADKLEKVMTELHHDTTHVGKQPRFWQKQQKQAEVRQRRQLHRQEMLQKRLEAALQAERYEEAAQIRDKIAQVAQTAD